MKEAISERSGHASVAAARLPDSQRDGLASAGMAYELTSCAEIPHTNGHIFPSVHLRICARGQPALEMLLEAYVYAQDVDHDLWDFALEIDVLRKCGLANSDLRWMLCKGFLQQAVEVPASGAQARCFQATPNLSFSDKSCFVLTESGLAFARKSLYQAQRFPDASKPSSLVQPTGIADPLCIKPSWDRDRQELRVADQVVKQFKVPAPNQEMILAAFHEEDWPVRIDDPLPPRPDLEPKRRLHDTINSLNRNQKAELVRFLGDGSGQGVRWEFVFPLTSPHQRSA